MAAVRELKEECGLVGVATSLSPCLNLSPGISNETAAIVRVNVDLASDVNSKPQQELEESEDIEVMYVPIKGLTAKLNDFSSEGCSVFLGLFTLAAGLEMTC